MAIINGTNTANTLNGGAGNDSISGLGGADTINGGAGDDTINGGPGIDVMTGGAGADVFVFANGDGGNVEPHDRITDFQVGTDRLQLPGAIISTQAVSNGTYVNYAGGDTYNWILLDGVINPNLAQLTNPGASPPPPPPPPTGGIPPHTVVGFNDFTNGFDDFTNRWGVTTHNAALGAIEATSVYGVWADAGAMVQYSNATGYGLYEFDAQFSNRGPGGYILTWPANNVWPGPELDIAEVLPGGRVYSTIHWDANPGIDGNEDNAYTSYLLPSNIDPTVRHVYAMNWQQSYIDMYVDGVQYAHITEHVPLDAAHGGLNTTPGIGEQTWWNIADQENHDNTVRLYDFTYSLVA